MFETIVALIFIICLAGLLVTVCFYEKDQGKDE